MLPREVSLSDAAAIPKNARTVQADRRLVSLLLMAATTFCGGAPAVAQDYDSRSPGERTGTVDRPGPDRYILRDITGRRTGTIDQGIDGRLVIRDSHERRTGTMELGPSKDLIIRDTNSRRVGTLSPQPGGTFAIHSPSGRRAGTISRR
jgi:hypothetical protein